MSGADAHYQIRRLLSGPGAAFVTQHRWSHEAERWNELVAALLSVTLKLPRAGIAHLVGRMNILGLLDVDTWSELPADFDAASKSATVERSLELFEEHGVKGPEGMRAIRSVHEAAHAVQARYRGHIQIALREAGEQVLALLKDALNLTSIPDFEARQALTLWLQNVLNLPISLQSANLDAFSKRHAISVEKLTEAADELNLSIPALDDLVEYWAHEEKVRADRRSRGESEA